MATATKKIVPPQGGSGTAPAGAVWTPDVGDRVFVAVWRPTLYPRPGELLGQWTTVWGRVLGASRDGTQVSYETNQAVPSDYDTPDGSKNRFAQATHVFQTQTAADEACRALPPPTN